ncbi:HdeD family acid-resistance protein [Zobellia nedashkovskayae]
MNTLLDSTQKAINNWWISILVGILYLFIGVWVIRTPLESYLSLSMLFSFFILASGIFHIVFAISNRNVMEGLNWYLLAGLLDLIVGTLLLVHPLMTMMLLPIFVGFWLLFQSILSLGLSFQLKVFGVTRWGLLIFWGIVTLLLSLLILTYPFYAGLSLVYMTAFGFITAGVFRIFLGFDLKKMGKNL